MDSVEIEEEIEEEEEEEEVEEEVVQTHVEKSKPAASTNAAAVSPKEVAKAPVKKAVVEDVDEDNEKKAELELKKQEKEKFDGIISVASKFAKGEKHRQAAEKYSEALLLAPTVSKKDLPTLYNNRSAMYEKLKEYDLSLADIDELLKLDSVHSKGRARKARILEIQGKSREALVEYCYIAAFLQYKMQTIMQQAQGMPESLAEATFGPQLQPIQTELQAAAGKVESLAKSRAAERSLEHLDRLKQPSDSRTLPCTAACRSFFETFPSYYTYSTGVSGEEEQQEEEEWSEVDLGDIARVVGRVTGYIGRDRYNKAYALVQRAVEAWEQSHGSYTSGDVGS